MVYRDVSPEEAQKRYADLTQADNVPALTPVTMAAAPVKPKRKSVKALVPSKK